ncbi:MAG: DUF29 domain-containing protein [Acetobacteraceae bacterium]
MRVDAALGRMAASPSPSYPQAAMNALYETDILEWSEQQAALLRRLAKGERVNDQVDWENVVEEIESVGNEQRHALESHLIQALLHMLKAEAWPEARDRPHWQAEARGRRNDARRRFAPSMGGRINLDELYRDALSRLPDSYDGKTPLPVPHACPVTLDELLRED